MCRVPRSGLRSRASLAPGTKSALGRFALREKLGRRRKPFVALRTNLLFQHGKFPRKCARANNGAS